MAFSLYGDRDGSGFIEESELRTMLHRFSSGEGAHTTSSSSSSAASSDRDERVEALVARIMAAEDTNHDGKLSWDEFKRSALAAGALIN